MRGTLPPEASSLAIGLAIRAWRSGLPRELRVDLLAAFRELASAFATTGHAPRRTDQREPASHVIALVGVQVGEHAAVVFLDELAIRVPVPVAPAGAPVRAAPSI